MLHVFTPRQWSIRTRPALALLPGIGCSTLGVTDVRQRFGVRGETCRLEATTGLVATIGDFAHKARKERVRHSHQLAGQKS